MNKFKITIQIGQRQIDHYEHGLTDKEAMNKTIEYSSRKFSVNKEDIMVNSCTPLPHKRHQQMIKKITKIFK